MISAGLLSFGIQFLYFMFLKLIMDPIAKYQTCPSGAVTGYDLLVAVAVTVAFAVTVVFAVTVSVALLPEQPISFL